MMFKLLLFDFVEALSEDAGDVGITDKGIRVDGLDEFENQRSLVLSCEDGDDHHRLLAIPTFAIENRYAAVNGRIDGGSNLC